MLSESKGGYRVLTGVQVARWAGHIVSIGGRPAVVAGMTIVPNIDPTLLKGTPNLLLSITYIDEAFIADVGHSLLLPDLALAPQAAKADGIVSEAFVGDDGIPVGYLNWTTKRPGPGAVDHHLAAGGIRRFRRRRAGEHDAAAASPHVGRIGRARGPGAARSEARCAFRVAEPRAHGREDRQFPAGPSACDPRQSRRRRLSRRRSLQGHQRHAGPPRRRPIGEARGAAFEGMPEAERLSGALWRRRVRDPLRACRSRKRVRRWPNALPRPSPCPSPSTARTFA